MIEVKVENIVASAIFAEKLDLDVIATSLKEAKIRTRTVPRAVYRVKEPRVVMLLFGSSKIKLLD